MDRPYRDPDWLEQKYHGEGLTQREIAEECGVASSTIRKYMQRFGIETRELEGENHGLHGGEAECGGETEDFGDPQGTYVLEGNASADF